MRFLLLLSVIPLMWGCSGSAPETNSAHIGNTPLKTLKVDSTLTIEAKDLISNISIVRLESSWKNIIGHVDQLLFADDKMIIFDRNKAKAVFVFDRNGKFLNRIGMLGHGPQEYVEPSYIALVPGTNQVAVFDLSPKKVKIYNLDGKFVRSEDIPVYIFSAEYLTDHIKVGATIGRRYLGEPEWGKASLFIFNKNWEVTFTGFQDPFPESLYYTSTNNLKKFGDRVYYTPAYEDRIYRVYPDSIQLLYQLDLGDRALPVPGKYQQRTDKQFEALIRKHNTFDGYFTDSKDWMLFKIADGYQVRALVYNKIKDSTYYLAVSYNNPFENALQLADFAANDSCAVAPVDASVITTVITTLRENLTSQPQNRQTEQIIEQLSSVTENNNPVLFFFTLKSGR